MTIVTEEKRKFITEVRIKLFDREMSFPAWCKENGFSEGLARNVLHRYAMSPRTPQGFKSYKIIKALERDTGMSICGVSREEPVNEVTVE
jgi:hypothetical protein